MVAQSIRSGGSKWRKCLLLARSFLLSLKTASTALTRIGTQAFAGCSKLKTFKATSKKLVSVGNAAFKGCKRLTAFSTASPKFTTVGTAAFKNCVSLKTFKVTSKKLSTIGESAFSGCKKLKKLSIAYTTKLTKKGVKGSLKGSKVTTVDVKNSKKAAYKKIFTKANCGRKVTVK